MPEDIMKLCRSKIYIGLLFTIIFVVSCQKDWNITGDRAKAISQNSSLITLDDDILNTNIPVVAYIGQLHPPEFNRIESIFGERDDEGSVSIYFKFKGDA